MNRETRELRLEARDVVRVPNHAVDFMVGVEQPLAEVPAVLSRDTGDEHPEPVATVAHDTPSSAPTGRRREASG